MFQSLLWMNSSGFALQVFITPFQSRRPYISVAYKSRRVKGKNADPKNRQLLCWHVFCSCERIMIKLYQHTTYPSGAAL